MKNSIKTFRPAIAMIELIFALVIMGLVLMTAPIVLNLVAKSNTVTFQQESIAMAAAHTNALMTYNWDNSNNLPGGDNILNVTRGDNELNDGNRTLTYGGARIRDFTALFATTSFGVDATDNGIINDIDDFTTLSNSVLLSQDPVGHATNSANEGEYIDTKINIKTNIVYGNDVSNYDDSSGNLAFSNPSALVGGGSSHIKLIETKLTSSRTGSDEEKELKKEIVLHAFICNIGSARPRSKGSF